MTTNLTPRCTVCDYPLLGQADKERRQCSAHCPCGHPLWAPLSIARGLCEACCIRAKHES